MLLGVPGARECAAADMSEKGCGEGGPWVATVARSATPHNVGRNQPFLEPGIPWRPGGAFHAALLFRVRVIFRANCPLAGHNKSGRALGALSRRIRISFISVWTLKTLKQLWATIGVRKVAKPSNPALNLFRACNLKVDRSATPSCPSSQVKSSQVYYQ